MVADGERLLGRAIERVSRLRDRLGRLPGLDVMGSDILGHDSVAEWDPLKLSIEVAGLGITGYQAREWLESEHRLTTQLGDARRVVCSLTYADDDAAVERLATAFEQLAAQPPAADRPAPEIPPLEDFDLEQVMSPRDAFFASTEQVKDPVGRIAAEMISPYPPGVPAVLPGERLNSAVVDYLRASKAAGATTPDASDPGLDTFRVVQEQA
jgi:arginine/lysine/ornithine decarboxylase